MRETLFSHEIIKGKRLRLFALFKCGVFCFFVCLFCFVFKVAYGITVQQLPSCLLSLAVL